MAIRCEPDRLEISGGQGTHTGRQRLAADLSGPPVHTAFTVTYLLQALESMTGERVVLRLGPGVGKVLVTDPQEPAYQHVLMSRRLPG